MCTPCAGGRPHQTAAAKKLAKLQISDNHNSATGRRFKIQIAAAVLIQIVAQQAAPFHGVKQLARHPERAHRRAGRGRHNHRPALTTHDHTKLKNRNKRSIPTNARAMIGITTAHVASSYPSSPYADNGCGVKRPTILSRTSFNSQSQKCCVRCTIVKDGVDTWPHICRDKNASVILYGARSATRQ